MSIEEKDKVELIFKTSEVEGHRPSTEEDELVVGEIALNTKDNDILAKSNESGRIGRVNRAKVIATNHEDFERYDSTKEVLHVVAGTHAASGSVHRPVAESPISGNQNVSTQPTLLGSAFRTFKTGVLRKVRHFQIDIADKDFSTPLFSTAMNQDFFFVPTPLPPRVMLKWRCRDEDLEDEFSDWTLPQYFAVEYSGIAAPNLFPSENVNSLSAAPTIYASMFEVINGNDTHSTTDWRILDGDTIIWQKSGSIGTELKEIQIPEGVLSQGRTYVFMARFIGNTLGAGEWGEMSATTKPFFYEKPIIVAPHSGTENFNGDVIARWMSILPPSRVIWVASREPSFSNLVDTFNGETNLTSWQPSIDPVINHGQTVYIKLRYQVNGQWTDWSDTTYFNLPLIKVKTPSITADGENLMSLPEAPTFIGSPFEMDNGTGRHVETEFVLIEGTETVAWTATLEDGDPSLTQIQIPTGVLEEGASYFLRMRYSSAVYGKSEWVQQAISTKAFFTEPFGGELSLDNDRYAVTQLKTGFEPDQVEWQASSTGTFSDLFNSYVGTLNYNKWDPAPDYIVMAGQTVYIRVRFKKDGFWSDWKWISYDMEPVFIRDPILTVQGAPSAVPFYPKLTVSDFDPNVGNDTHTSTDWRVLDAGSQTLWEVSATDADCKTEIYVPPYILEEGKDYYFEVRFNGNTHQSSGWVRVAAFTQNEFDLPIVPGSHETAGKPMEGGYYAGGNIIVDGTEYALIVASVEQTGLQKLQSKTQNTATVGSDSEYDGRGNTQAMMTAGSELHPAAAFCDNLELNGFSDWHLPSMYELEILHRYLNPIDNEGTNGTDDEFYYNISGWNGYANPQTQYHSIDPTIRTTEPIFQQDFEACNTTEAFQTSEYVSSTEGVQDLRTNFVLHFGNGTLREKFRGIRTGRDGWHKWYWYYVYSPYFKNQERFVRPVRWKEIGPATANLPVTGRMFSDSSNGNSAFSSSIYSNSYKSFMAFDWMRVGNSAWISSNGAAPTSESPEHVGITFPEARDVGVYEVFPYTKTTGSVYGSPQWFKLQGSNDGSSWTDLENAHQISGGIPAEGVKVTLTQTFSYSSYRLLVADQASHSYISIGELVLLES